MMTQLSGVVLQTMDLENITRPSSELELVQIIVDHRCVFGSIDIYATEVRSHGTSRLDIVLLEDERLIGVEAKLSNWGKAIAQAACNKYCVDESFIGIWEGKYLDAACTSARRFGIGVLAIGSGGVWIAQDPQVQSPDRILREGVLSRISGVTA